MNSNLLTFLVSLLPQSDTFSDKAIDIIDDDSIIIFANDNNQIKNHLDDIVNPEHNQEKLYKIIRNKKVRNLKDRSSFIMHPDSKTEIFDSIGNAVNGEI